MNARRVFRVSAIILAALALLAAAAFHLGASMGLFSGKRPTDLGFRDGAFKAGDWKPNWVSSTAPKDDAKHYVAPFAFRGDRAKAWAALDAAISATPRAAFVRRDPGYIHAEFATKAGFVDDAEFAMAADGSAIHVRSGARLGIRDFGVNRTRVEALRASIPGG